MGYLSTEDRTVTLLETIEHAEQLLEAEQDAEALLRIVIATARMHYHWPETDRKRQEEWKREQAEKDCRTPEPNTAAPIADPQPYPEIVLPATS